MNTTIQKWGNSLALRIPAAVAKRIHVGEGDDVELRVDADSLVVRPARPRYRLSALIRGIKDSNRHEETDWGRPVGREDG
jgi:antitoxin MazE